MRPTGHVASGLPEVLIAIMSCTYHIVPILVLHGRDGARCAEKDLSIQDVIEKISCSESALIAVSH
jgi:hypothetical protein